MNLDPRKESITMKMPMSTVTPHLLVVLVLVGILVIA